MLNPPSPVQLPNTFCIEPVKLFTPWRMSPVILSTTGFRPPDMARPTLSPDVVATSLITSLPITLPIIEPKGPAISPPTKLPPILANVSTTLPELMPATADIIPVEGLVIVWIALVATSLPVSTNVRVSTGLVLTSLFNPRMLATEEPLETLKVSPDCSSNVTLVPS